MYNFGEILEMCHYMLNSKSKRHMIGGTLISLSLFFSGMAITVMTIKKEEKSDEE